MDGKISHEVPSCNLNIFASLNSSGDEPGNGRFAGKAYDLMVDIEDHLSLA